MVFLSSFVRQQHRRQSKDSGEQCPPCALKIPVFVYTFIKFCLDKKLLCSFVDISTRAGRRFWKIASKDKRLWIFRVLCPSWEQRIGLNFGVNNIRFLSQHSSLLSTNRICPVGNCSNSFFEFAEQHARTAGRRQRGCADTVLQHKVLTPLLKIQLPRMLSSLRPVIGRSQKKPRLWSSGLSMTGIGLVFAFGCSIYAWKLMDEEKAKMYVGVTRDVDRQLKKARSALE